MNERAINSLARIPFLLVLAGLPVKTNLAAGVYKVMNEPPAEATRPLNTQPNTRHHSDRNPPRIVGEKSVPTHLVCCLQ